MSVDRGYVTRNDTERARLAALIRTCTDADLARPMPAGWTVAGVLGHLAFWDQRIVTLVEAWEKDGPAAVPPTLDEKNIDWVNDAAKPMLLAVPPRRAAELTLAIAEAADGKVASLSDDLIARNAAAGNPLNLDRAEHRREHLDEIERVLRARGA
jgi:hypothetical protein